MFRIFCIDSINIPCLKYLEKKDQERDEEVHVIHSRGWLVHKKKNSNFKTVKDKRSTNIPQMFRYLKGMKPKLLSSFPNLSYWKISYLFGPEEQILDQIERICFKKTNSGTLPKRFGFVPKRYPNVCPFPSNYYEENTVLPFSVSNCYSSNL